MADLTKMPFVWIAKLKKYRRFAAVLFLWILCINIVLALLWLEPMNSELLTFKQNELKTYVKEISAVPYYSASKTVHVDTTQPNYDSLKTTANHVYVEYKLMSKVSKNHLSDLLFDVVDSKTNGVLNSDASFVLIVPRRLQSVSPEGLSKDDHTSAMTSAQILTGQDDLDGLACLPRKFQTLVYNTITLSDDNLKGLFNKTWCNFARFSWSIHIRNSGKLSPLTLKLNNASSTNEILMQMCNIVNGPFLLKKKLFEKLKGLQTNYGRVTMLDFFLRSGGNLKIGKYAGCFYSDEYYQPDRGSLHGVHDFPEYSDFGSMHGVLRIVMENRIEWTRCYANDRLCKEKPYTPPTTLPDAGKPICCSVVLTQMLQAIVAVFDKLGIEYRILYGTLLGALRSGTIIPYVYDLDLAADDRFGLNWSRYDTLQKYFEDDYTISSNSFMGMPRLLPLLPPYININTSQFFDGEFDLEGKKFFSPEITESVKGLIPFSPSNWRTRGYTDFYRGWPVWWNDSSIVQIDGYNYTAMKETEYEVKLWYGQNWRTPILQHFQSQSDTGAV